MRDEDRIVYLGPNREAFGEPGASFASRDIAALFWCAIKDRATSACVFMSAEWQCCYLVSGQWFGMVAFEDGVWDEFLSAVARNANLIHPVPRTANTHAAVGWLDVRIAGLDRLFVVAVTVGASEVRFDFWPTSPTLAPPDPWADKPIPGNRG